ncbi:MAG: hypothetical protein M3337_02255 [Actinomycetota bacterium]|nr:hypothetical protein [Actinomycetota bacterium]
MTAVIAQVRQVPERWLYVVLFVVLAVPLIVSLIALRSEPWHPVLDLAMTELRVRDVGASQTPLIGLPGRIGELPEQGSHPGPLSFWLLAPTYHLLGQSSYALEVGTVLIHLVVIAMALSVGRRLGARTGMILVAVVLAVVMRGYGTLLLIQPWNPYLPLLAWLLVLFATWAVVAGHHRWLVAVAAVGTLCAQTHISYLLLCSGMFMLASAAVIARTLRADAETAGAERREGRRSLAIAGGVGGLLWLPPVIQEFQGGEGNISRLVSYFTSPPEEPVGFEGGFRLLVRHLNVVDGFFGLIHGSQRFMAIGLDDTSARVPGILVGILWLVAGAVCFAGVGSYPLRSLHVVIAAALVLSLVSMSRIFGTTLYYLTLWAWGLAALVLVSIVWTAIAVVERVRVQWRPGARSAAVVVAAIVLMISTAMFSIDAADAGHAEQHLSRGLRELVDPTYEALVEGVGEASGPDGRYLVQWSDAHFFGSQVYGLISELDDRGLDVGGHPYFTVPLTPERTMPVERATAEVHFASGAYIELWEDVPGAVEVAAVDLRSPEERRRYEALRRQVIDGLRRDGRDDLVELVDFNVFGLDVDPRIGRDIRRATSQMLQIGTEIAVFIIPKGASLNR